MADAVCVNRPQGIFVFKKNLKNNLVGSIILPPMKELLHFERSYSV